MGVVRTSEATWKGDVQDGGGETTLGSGAWQGEFTYRSRFEEEEPVKSNPEELLAAGHASCYTMALANYLTHNDYEPNYIHATADCYMEMKETMGPTIVRIDLEVEADIPNIEETKFQKYADQAKINCPISRALSDVEITLDASL